MPCLYAPTPPKLFGRPATPRMGAAGCDSVVGGDRRSSGGRSPSIVGGDRQ